MRCSRYMMLLFFTLTILGCHSLTSASKAPDPYLIAVGADPQLFMRQKNDDHWQKTVDGIIRVKPDFFIVCGDLTNAANKASKWEDPKKVKEYERQADAFLAGADRLRETLPVYHVAGNHDVTVRPTPERLKWYEKKFGKAWYSFEHKNSLFVVLESNLLRDPSGAPSQAKKQLDWLRETLEDSVSKKYHHKFAFLHHPLCLKDINEKDSYYNVGLEMRKSLFSFFKKHDFSAVFSGHLHRNNYLKLEGLEMITTASCCVPLGKDPRGVHLVKVLEEEIVHEYRSIEALTAPKKNDE